MTQRKSRSIGAGLVALARYFAVWLASATGVLAADPEGIPWRSDLGRARAEAHALGRPLWIQFTGPWCHNCTRMDRETFPQPTIGTLAREFFVPLKLQSDVFENLALQYGLTGIPATVLVKPTGELIAKQEGFLEPEPFRAYLESGLGRYDPHGLYAARRAGAAKSDEGGVALAGYCPVSLVSDHRLVPGQTEVAIRHEGRLYRFANALLLNTFKKQPERYLPVNGGRCPVAQVERGEVRPGHPQQGALYQGHLYLCADEANLNKFLTDPEKYAHVDVADRGFCPHCLGAEGLLVRGHPEYSLVRGGRRYLFPSQDHLEAFRAGTETARR